MSKEKGKNKRKKKKYRGLKTVKPVLGKGKGTSSGKQTVTTDKEETITLDCPACKSGEVTLTRKIVDDEDLGTVWKGVTCDNVICTASFSMERKPDKFTEKKSS